LAVACFVKVFGVVFLGGSRTPAAEHAHESPLSMRGPMAVLAACCALIGLAPVLVSPILDKVIATWSPEQQLGHLSVATLVPLKSIAVMSLALVALVTAFAVIAARYRRVAHSANTWDCGYARPTNRMQYTASSFAQMIVSLFRWVLRPRVHQTAILQVFPPLAKLHTEVDDLVLDRVLMPGGRLIERGVAWIRTLQQSLTQHCVLYILITVVLMLSTLFPFGAFVARLFAR
jgi:hydrogenase-4 component B